MKEAEKKSDEELEQDHREEREWHEWFLRKTRKFVASKDLVN